MVRGSWQGGHRHGGGGGGVMAGGVMAGGVMAGGGKIPRNLDAPKSLLVFTG